MSEPSAGGGASRHRGFALERMSVLLVDDNRYMITLIAEVLLGLGIRNVA